MSDSRKVSLNNLIATLSQSIESITAFTGAECKRPNIVSLTQKLEATVTLDELLKVHELLSQSRSAAGETKGELACTQADAKHVENFLARSWERIRGTDLAYPHAPSTVRTMAAVNLADAIASIVGKGRYSLLMPTIKFKKNDITYTELDKDNLNLWQFILDDNDEGFIEVLECLKTACEDGLLKHQRLFEEKTLEGDDKQVPKQLSSLESQRVIDHSSESRAFWNATYEVIKVSERGTSFGLIIQHLVDRLTQGSYRRHGSEYKAGQDALNGIKEFNNILAKMSPIQRKRIYELQLPGKHNFKYYWLLLIAQSDLILELDHIDYLSVAEKEIVKKENYQPSVIPCAHILQQAVYDLLKGNKWVYEIYPDNKESKAESIVVLQELRDQKEAAFFKALEAKNYRVTNLYGDEGVSKLIARLGQYSQCKISISQFLIEFGKSANDFIRAISLFSGEDQTEFLKNFPKERLRSIIIENRGRINDILLELNDKSLMIFLDYLIVKNYNEVLTLNTLIMILERIPEAGRIKFLNDVGIERICTILNNYTHKQFEPYLGNILSNIPMSFWKQWLSTLLSKQAIEKVLTEGGDVGRCLNQLSPEHWKNVIDLLGRDKIFAIITRSPKEFGNCIQALRPAYRKFFLNELEDRHIKIIIPFPHVLADVLQQISTEEWEEFLNTLGEKRLNVILKFGEKKESDEEKGITVTHLFSALSRMPYGKSEFLYAFGAVRLQRMISSSIALGNVIGHLSQDEQLAFLDRFPEWKNLINTPDDVVVMMAKMKSANVPGFTERLGNRKHLLRKISDAKELANVMSSLSENMQFPFLDELKDWQSLIRTNDCLVEIIKNTQSNNQIGLIDRLGGYKFLQTKITNVEEWIKIFSSIAIEIQRIFFDRLEVNYFRECLNSHYKLCDMLTKFPKEKRLKFINCLFNEKTLQSLLDRDYKLIQVLDLLNDEDRCELLRELGDLYFESMTKDSYSLARMMHAVPDFNGFFEQKESKRDDDSLRSISRKARSLISNTEELVNFMKECLNGEIRDNFLGKLGGEHLSNIIHDQNRLANTLRGLDKVHHECILNALGGNTLRRLLLPQANGIDQNILNEIKREENPDVKNSLFLALNKAYHFRRSEAYQSGGQWRYKSIFGCLFGYSFFAKRAKSEELEGAIREQRNIDNKGALNQGDLGVIARAYRESINP